MNSAIGHRGRHGATPVPAAVCGRPEVAASMSRHPRTVRYGFAIAFLWLAASGMPFAASATATWSLLPAPADGRPASSGVVEIVDGARVAVRGADRRQVQPTVDRFMQLVGTT